MMIHSATKFRKISKPRKKSLSRLIALQFSRRLGNIAADTPGELQINMRSLKNDISHPQVFARFGGKASIRLVSIGLKPLGYTVHTRTAGVAQCHGHMEKTHRESIIYPITSSYHEISYKIGYWNVLIALQICRMISSSSVKLLIKLKSACHSEYETSIACNVFWQTKVSH